MSNPVMPGIVEALLDGKAYTARELANSTKTPSSKIIEYLDKLTAADVLTLLDQGRHQYYKLSEQIPLQFKEHLSIPALQPESGNHFVEGPLPPFVFCRTCYNHLAGRIGVLITRHLVHQKYLLLSDDKHYRITPTGEQFFRMLQIDLELLKDKNQIFAKPCLDRSERKFHLSGALGKALLEKMQYENWVQKSGHSRIVTITKKGRRALGDWFEIYTKP